MNNERRKLGKMALTGFILPFITPLTFILLITLFNGPGDHSLEIVIWCASCFFLNCVACDLSIIGIILCKVKKRRGTAYGVWGIIFSQLALFFVFIVFCAAFLHESPPSPPPSYYQELSISLLNLL